MTVGAELAQARRKLGLTLEDVSARTKISVDRLAAIEEGDVPRLPSFVYLKGFLRAFASEVHLDPDAITSRYLAALGAEALGSLDSQTRTIVLSTEDHSALDQFDVETEPLPRSSAPQVIPEPEPKPRVATLPPAVTRAPAPREPVPAREPVATRAPAATRGPAAARATAAARAKVAEDRTRKVAVAMPALDYESELAPRSRKEIDRSPEARPGFSGPDDLGSEGDSIDVDDGGVGDLLLDSPLFIEPRRSGGAPRFLDAYGDDEIDERRDRRTVRFGVTAVVVLLVAVLTGWTLGEHYSAILARVGTYVPVVAQQIAGAVANIASDFESPGQVSAPGIAASVPSDPSSIPSNAQPAAPEEARTEAERLQAASGAHISPTLPAAAMAPPDQQSSNATARQVESEGDGPSEPRASANDATRSPAAQEARSRVEPEQRSTAASSGTGNAAAGDPVPPSAPASHARDFGLTGRWTFTNRVESSADGARAGTNVSFHIQLRQDGARISGTGEKWMENGRPLPPGSRTPISVEGRLTGDRLELTYVERGVDGMTTGSFVLQTVDRDTLWGEFSSGSPGTRGSALARRAEAAPE